MIHKATQLISDFFKASGLRCKVHEADNLSYVESGFNGDNCTLNLRFISADDDCDVKIVTEEFVKYPGRKLQDGYEMMNELSRSYRFFKFVMNEKGAVYVQYDLPLSLPPDSVGKTALEMAVRCVKIVDDAYPKIMKSIWG